MIGLLKKLGRPLPHRRRYYHDMLFRRVDKRALRRFLSHLGLRPGMILYIQSSFGSIGYFRKGAGQFIELLVGLVGESGTIVMPSFPFKGSMEDFVKTKPTFKVNSTPSLVGLLPEVLRGKQGARRSVHPTHPVVALGAHAHELTEGHERTLTPQGRDSPYAKMVALGAHVLRIGAPAFPFCHHLQEAVELPNLFITERAELSCVDPRGRSIKVATAVYRKKIPFVFYVDGESPGNPAAINIIDFPIIFDDRTGGEALSSPGRNIALDRLVEIRERFTKDGSYRLGRFNGCILDLTSLLHVFDFAVAEARTLIQRYEKFYELARLESGVRSGQIRI